MGKKTEETIWLNNHGISYTRYTGTFKWDKYRHLRVTYDLHFFAKPLNPNQVENFFESRGFRLVSGRGQRWTKKIYRVNVDICTECGKHFKADKTNSVNIKIMGFYGICCKECAIKLKKEGKIRIIKQGSIPL